MSPPPTPFHILRTHHAPLSCLSFNPAHTLLLAGDQDGFVSVTDLRLRRVVAHWKAHEGGVLGVEEWAGRLISHGRDNVIHMYDPLPSLRGPSLAAGPNPSTRSPGIWKSLPSNSLNFCKFSLLSLGPSSRTQRNGKVKDGGSEKEALLAVPNLVDSELADVYHLPSMRRLHAGVNVPKPDVRGDSGGSGKGKGKARAVDGGIDADEVQPEGTRSGLIMSLHLGFLPVAKAMEAVNTGATAGNAAEAGDIEATAGGVTGDDASSDRHLGLAMGYEDGRVEVWACASGSNPQEAGEEGWRCFSDGRGAVGPRRWELVFVAKGHNEAVMAMTATPDLSHLWTVSADHLLCHYTVPPLSSHAHSSRPSSSLDNRPDASAPVHKWSTKQIGNASIALSADQRVVAVGGWDGRIRLFSSRTGKPLGTLGYHRETVHCVAFPTPKSDEYDARGSESRRTKRAGHEDEGQVEADEGESRDKGANGKESEGSEGSVGEVGEVGEVEAEEGRSADAETETETVEIGLGDSDDDEESEEGDTPPVERWFASGGKDRRIAIWALKSFVR